MVTSMGVAALNPSRGMHAESARAVYLGQLAKLSVDVSEELIERRDLSYNKTGSKLQNRSDTGK